MISNLYLKKNTTLRLLKASLTLVAAVAMLGLNAQTIFWSDNFDAPAGGANNNNAAAGWTLNVGQAAGGNQWYINTGTGCGSGNRLHISCGSGLCSFLGGPNAAIYNAGSASYDKYSSSPDISTVGRTNITLKFRWRSAGSANNDYGLLRFSGDGGANWTDQATRYQSTSSCQTATITVPAQYEGISNFRIGFRWINNADNAGSDPPFDIDNIELSVPSSSCPVVITNQTSTNPTCNGTNNGTITITATGGSPLTYTISSGTPQNNQTGTFTNLTPGTYTVSVSDGTCSTAGTNITITNPAVVPTPTVSSNSPLCTGDTLKLTASNITNATYAWSGPNGNNFNTQNPQKNGVVLADAGTYSVVATVGSCNSGSATTSVSINTRPANPTASSNSPLCEGSTLNLTSTTAAGATIYSWTGPNNFSNQQNPSKPNVTTADGGVYTVVAINGNCQSAPSSTTVIIGAQPGMPVLNSNSPVCEGDTLKLMADDILGATFNWTGPTNFADEQNPAIANATSADSGTYTVIASIGSCVSPPASITVDVNPAPAAPNAVTNSPLCSGATLTLSSDSVEGATYTWTGPNGFSVTSSVTSRAAVAVEDSGDYTITASVGSCSKTATTHVVVNETPTAPVISAANTTICASDSVEACAPAGFAAYHWNQNGETTQCGVAKFAGGFWVDVTATNGCSVRSNTLTISTYPVSPVSIIKSGDTLSTFGAQTYQWFKDGVAVSGANSAVFIATGPGTYSVQITDNNGCKATSTGLVITGLNNIRRFEGIEIYPNPSNGKFNIHYTGDVNKQMELSIFNVLGAKVLNRTAMLQKGTVIPMDISSMAKGIYLVQLQSGNEKMTERIVIE